MVGRAQIILRRHRIQFIRSQKVRIYRYFRGNPLRNNATNAHFAQL